MKKKTLFTLIIAFIVTMVLFSFTGCKGDNGKPNNTPKYSISITDETMQVTLGETANVSVKTEGINKEDLVWSSNNESVLTVNNGVVKANKVGTALVTASFEEYSDTISISVTLGNYVPQLKTYIEGDIGLIIGQEYEVSTYIDFNGKSFTDYQLNTTLESNVVSCAVNGNSMTITALALGEVSIPLSASWNGVDGEGTPTLNITLNVIVEEDVYFTVNGKGTEDIVLYTCDSFEGQNYNNQLDIDVGVVKDDELLNNATIEINSDNADAVIYENGKLKSVGMGTATITISYKSESGEVYECTFKVNVVRPQATINKLVTYEVLDNTLDLSEFDFEQSEILNVEIAGSYFSVHDGEFPAMQLLNATTAGTSQHSEDEVLHLIVDGIANPIEIEKTAEDKDFASIIIKIYLQKYVYELTNVKLYSKIIKDKNDIDEVFGDANITSRLEGYYVLANNVDASGIDFNGANKAASNFFGIFDGMGYAISNADVSGRDEGSFFGNVQGHATIRNVAFVNVKATWSNVIANYAGGNTSVLGSGWPNPAISNVYISVSNDTNIFFGLGRNLDAFISNVIVEYPVEERSEVGGSFIGGDTAANRVFTDCYVISKTYCTTVNEGGTMVERTYEGLTRYDTLLDMIAAENSYSSFSVDYWNLENGVPMWKNAPEIEVVISDNAARTYDLSTKELDFTGLNFTLADVKTVEIAGVKTDITNGVMPDMNLQNYTTAGTSQHSSDDVLRLTIGESYLETTKLAADKDFAGAKFKFYLNNGDIYELTNVKLYSKIIKDKNDLESIFGDEYIARRLEGYYVLENNVDASGIDFSGANKAASNFFGIFDGMGYTISNADVSGRDEGSFFGNVQGHATIRNVAFVNVKATWSNVIANYAGGNSSVGGSGWPNPAISNVYISVSSDTNTFSGLGRNLDAIVSNVIVEYPVEERCEVLGSFIGDDGRDDITFTDCYVISKTYCTTVNEGGTMVERTYEGLTRYDTIEDMLDANNNYSSFNESYWSITNGIPVWKNLPN